MKTTPFFYIIAFVFLVACRSEPAADIPKDETFTAADSLDTEDVKPPEGFLKTYEGVIGDKNEIKMMLINWGDGFLSGRYWYKKNGKPIELSGEKISQKKIELIEGTFDKETGAFSINFTDPTLLTGTWSSADKQRNLPFQLKESASPLDSTGWSGNWYLNEIWDSGTLFIGNVTDKTFDFALNVVRSGHIGTIDGQAKINGSLATFQRKEFDEKPCLLRFIHKDDSIIIDQKSSSFSCGFGARAHATGKYERNYIPKNPSLGIGTSETDVFPDRTTHDAFNTLVGNAYEDFAFNMEQIEKGAADPQDNIEATVVVGGVSGLFTTNEAIIMFDGKGKFWAATISSESEDEEPVVLYFTNDPAYKKYLPETINKWRESFKNYRIVFK